MEDISFSAVFGSQQTLLPRTQPVSNDTTAFNPKRALKPGTGEHYLRKASSLLNLNEVKESHNFRLCQRSASRKMDRELPLLPSPPQEKKPPPSPLYKSDEELTIPNQHSTLEKSIARKDSISQSEKILKIGRLGIISNLQSIIDGKGVWRKIAQSCIRCCSDMNQRTEDREWFDYLSKKIKTVDEKSKEYWTDKPIELRTFIQEIIFCTLKTFHRYKSSMQDVKQEHLDSLNHAIQRVFQQYYLRFGEELFWQILIPETYTKRTMLHLASYHNAPWYDYDTIPKTLTKLLTPKTAELTYLPVLRSLIEIADRADKADMDTEAALGFDEQAMQEMAEKIEKQRLLTLFTHRPLSASLSPVASMEGFLNFNNTCFAAVSTWQILASSYIHLISPSSHPQTIECPTEDVETEQGEGYISLTSGEKAIPLNSLSPEECLTLVKTESDRDTKTVLLTAATRKCLVTMESQYRKKQYSEMQNTYELFLTLCTACASDDIFVGFENFHERYIKFILSQFLEKEAEDKKAGNSQSTEDPGQKDKLPVFPLKHLPQQDSAEFLASLLKLVLPREQLNKCAFRLLTERLVMKGPDILTITDDPRTTPTNTPEVSSIKDTVNPDTLIYSVPVSLEQTERDNFSIQMILDDALSLKNITEGEHQKITLAPNNFRHAIRNFPSVLSRAKETGMGDQYWDVLQERQVLLVEDAPEVITIQPKMVHELCDRAKIAEKLAHDDTEEFQLTFRKCSTDAEHPPEEITQKYRIVAKVFYVEEGEARTRHYRCLISGKDRLPESDEHKVVDSVVMDDKRVFITPSNQEHLIQLGILCMFTAEKISPPACHMEKAYAFTPIKADNHNIQDPELDLDQQTSLAIVHLDEDDHRLLTGQSQHEDFASLLP